MKISKMTKQRISQIFPATRLEGLKNVVVIFYRVSNGDEDEISKTHFSVRLTPRELTVYGKYAIFNGVEVVGSENI